MTRSNSLSPSVRADRLLVIFELMLLAVFLVATWVVAFAVTILGSQVMPTDRMEAFLALWGLEGPIDYFAKLNRALTPAWALTSDEIVFDPMSLLMLSSVVLLHGGCLLLFGFLLHRSIVKPLAEKARS